jgi:hypothetical protein
MNRKIPLFIIALVTGGIAAQCPPEQTRLGTDQENIARLEREARAIAKTEGCASADQCRSVPVGDRACGGPRDYIVYCARTTDSAALYRKVDELKKAEMAFNKKSGAMSTCEFRMPPTVGASGGQCKAIP